MFYLIHLRPVHALCLDQLFEHIVHAKLANASWSTVRIFILLEVSPKLKATKQAKIWYYYSFQMQQHLCMSTSLWGASPRLMMSRWWVISYQNISLCRSGRQCNIQYDTAHRNAQTERVTLGQIWVTPHTHWKIKGNFVTMSFHTHHPLGN